MLMLRKPHSEVGPILVNARNNGVGIRSHKRIGLNGRQPSKAFQ